MWPPLAPTRLCAVISQATSSVEGEEEKCWGFTTFYNNFQLKNALQVAPHVVVVAGCFVFGLTAV